MGRHEVEEAFQAEEAFQRAVAVEQAWVASAAEWPVDEREINELDEEGG